MKIIKSSRQDILAIHNFIHNFPIYIGYTLFFIMLFVPTAYQSIKAVLLFIVLFIIIISFFRKQKPRLHISVLSWTLVVTITGAFFLFIGSLNGTAGALRVTTVYFIWPWVYTLFIAGISRPHLIDGLIKVLLFSAIAVEIYILTYIFYSFNLLPSFLYVELDLRQAIGFHNGYIEYSIDSLSLLVFFLPFALAGILVWTKNSNLPISRSLLWIEFIIGILLALLSGRRALWLSLAFSGLISIPFSQLLPQVKTNSKRRLFIIALAITLFSVYIFNYLKSSFDLDISAMVEYFTAGFDSSRDESTAIRENQFYALVEGWLNSPFFGAGHGAEASVIRSAEQPWSYELSYIALLYHTGLIGILIYAGSIAWIYWMGIKVIRSGDRLGLYMFPVLVGTSSFLLANATNPYLTKYDYMWVIFLPLGLINCWLLKKNS